MKTISNILKKIEKTLQNFIHIIIFIVIYYHMIILLVLFIVGFIYASHSDYQLMKGGF